ncbi:MAG: glycosyl hydrolase [Tannerella sp.]|jgi:hypothetical protein|nr:glycosyl hydrolase [Tannerella sp.]
MKRIVLFFCVLTLPVIVFWACNGAGESELETGFRNPPSTARPGVYWYFMDGNRSKEAITKDLEAMKKVGIGYVVYLEVNVGVPRGKVDFFSDEWKDMFGYMVRECERLGIGIYLGTGPGWSGSGGPWVDASWSMQHLVCSSVDVEGAGERVLHLSVPQPVKPFFGLDEAIHKQWEEFYEDVVVLAFPSGATIIDTASVSGTGYWAIPEIEERALYYRKPYSSSPGVLPYISTYDHYASQPGDKAIKKSEIKDITALMQPDGTLKWDVPEGKWTVMRFGRRNNGAVTRPAPRPGLGMEADKCDTLAMSRHLDRFIGELFRYNNMPGGSKALETIHIDSWEMGAQNWTPRFREEFTNRRGYDPQPYYPAYVGLIVENRETTERFLWDMRQTIMELIVENHISYTKEYAHRYGLQLSIEPYDMNPASDLELAAAADMPMCEFWSPGGYNTSFSTGEGASVAHLLGQNVVPAEAFTAHLDAWRQHPASVKNQGEWAFAAGVNRLMYHTYQHQCLPDNVKPGMTMGPYGVHWDRNQTWWHLSDAYHSYVARCQFMLQQGRTVADILYLALEGAPNVFRAPASAYVENPLETMTPDRRGYNFDGCPPSMLYSAKVEDGRVVFPSGATYQALVLPVYETMTPGLLGKIRDLVNEGATVVGLPPLMSPSLSDYPACDKEIKDMATELWGGYDFPDGIVARQFGKGRIVWGNDLTNTDNLYPHYEVVAKLLGETSPPDFETTAPVRYTHRTTAREEIYFVSNSTDNQVNAICKFRVASDIKPELWNPVTGDTRALPEYSELAGQTEIPLKFDAYEGYFIVFRQQQGKSDSKYNFPEIRQIAVLDKPWKISFDPKWGGPSEVIFDQLTDWSINPDEGIKYYSGSAFYRQTFDLPDDANAKTLYLDLGKVCNMAHVKLNGQDLGTVWTSPWRVEITKAVKPSNNELEIEVVNLWANRLIGDEQKPDDGIKDGKWPEWLLNGAPRSGGRYTFASYRHYKKDSPLTESGLLGPVRIVHAK